MQTSEQYLNNFFTNFDRIFKELEGAIERKEWGFKYDQKSDVLYLLPLNKKISNDAVLLPAGDTEISAKIGPNGIEALIVEEFESFFIEKNPEFKPLFHHLTKREEIASDTLKKAYALLWTISNFRSLSPAF